MNWEDMTLEDQLADIGRRLALLDKGIAVSMALAEREGREMVRLHAEMTETLNKSLEVSHGEMD
jgi:hypothetical protein